MTFTIEAQKEETLLFIEIRAARHVDNLEITQTIQQLIVSEKPEGVLIDIRSNHQYPDAVMIYNRNYKQKEQVQPPYGIPFAIVDLKDHQSINSFREDIASNKGYCIRFFYDVESARVWLRQQIQNAE